MNIYFCLKSCVCICAKFIQKILKYIFTKLDRETPKDNLELLRSVGLYCQKTPAGLYKVTGPPWGRSDKVLSCLLVPDRTSFICKCVVFVIREAFQNINRRWMNLI